VSEKSLGRLEVVEPRRVWPDEARDFTPWMLANVDVLSSLLGMDLALEAAEHPVGNFSLDLIGRDEATAETVIVENQLEVSDHTHLGQIITYAAGTDPSTIVWVATGFRPEHRAAIDWLNARTDENTRVFGVLIKVVRIGNSEPAPAFELVAQPNDWEKQARKATPGSGQVTERAITYRTWWETALARIRSQHPDWTRGTTSDQNWADASLGISGAVISMAWMSQGLVTSVYFNSPDADLNRTRFERLYEVREAFEAALGETPIWDDMQGRKGARVMLQSDFKDVSRRGDWAAAIGWLIEKQAALRKAFAAAGGAT
jgi:hypothetical protein